MPMTTPVRTPGIAPILWFLAITFGVTYTVEFSLINSGIRFDANTIQTAPALWLLAVMWIPGLAALFTTIFVEKRPISELREALLLRMGSIGPYLLFILLAPIIFAAMYGLSWALGLTEPDLTMAALSRATGSTEQITTDTVLYLMLPMSIFIGPFINLAFGLGEELGWRGFLLPRLMPLGKVPAYLLLGVLWGLWHAPLIHVGFNYPGHPMAGIAMMCLLSATFGIFLNEMSLHYRSVFLAAFIHGAVNAQGYGIWSWVFPGIDPILGGSMGLTGAFVWLLTGAATMFILSLLRREK